jgi:lipopolysaccharide export system permease protein
LSFFWFAFQEAVVIPTYERKNDLSERLLKISRTESNTNVTVLSNNGSTVYSARHYNGTTQTLSDLIVVERDSRGRFLRRIDADWAKWDGARWQLHEAHVFARTGEGPRGLEHRYEAQVTFDTLSTEPDTFKRTDTDVEELQLQEAWKRIRSLKQAGLPHREALTNYYSRFSFALTPLVVTLLSSAIGGRFKKNVLLMSLLASLALSVVYYVIGMISELLAATGTLEPVVAAWGAVGLFMLTGIVLLRHART